MNPNQTQKPGKLLYVSRVAERLDCSKQHIYNLINDGKLGAVKIGKRGKRVPEQELEKFLEENSVIVL